MISPGCPKTHPTTSWCLFVTTAIVCCAAPSAFADNKPNIVILSGEHQGYREAAAAIATKLGDENVLCSTIELPKKATKQQEDEAVQKLIAARPTLVATAGARATTIALENVADVPVVFFMVPNHLDADFMETKSNIARLAGVAADVAPSDQLDWISDLTSKTDNLTILYSPRTTRTARAFATAARRRRLSVKTIEASKTEFPAAIESLNNTGAEGVIMIPDAGIYNTATVQRLLLWGIRQKKSVWAFSDGVVKAGALAGLYVNPSDVGTQTANIILRINNGEPPQKVGTQYANGIDHAVNYRTSEMIDVTLNEQALDNHTVRFGGQK